MFTVGFTGQQKRYGRALKVILHIGLPKTGSTFLQHWLVANEDALADSVAVISGDQGAQLLAQLCCDRDRFAHRPDFAANSNDEAIRTLLARLASLRDRNFDRVVISSEYFFLAEPGMLEIRSAAPADPAAAASDTLPSLPRNSREQAIGGNVAAIRAAGKR